MVSSSNLIYHLKKKNYRENILNIIFFTRISIKYHVLRNVSTIIIRSLLTEIIPFLRKP